MVLAPRDNDLHRARWSGQPAANFNDLLVEAGCAPGQTLLVRHADRTVGDKRLFLAWYYSHPHWEWYYRMQDRNSGPRFHDHRFIAMFIKAPARFIQRATWATVFIGVWEIIGSRSPRKAQSGERDHVKELNAFQRGLLYYPPDVLRQTTRLEDQVGRLVVEWPRPFQRWFRRADQVNLPLEHPLHEPCGPIPYSGQPLPPLPTGSPRDP